MYLLHISDTEILMCRKSPFLSDGHNLGSVIMDFAVHSHLIKYLFKKRKNKDELAMIVFLDC